MIEDEGYLTDNLGREALSFIRRHQDKPFFLYLAFNAVHVPLQAPEATISKYDTGNPSRDILLAMIEHQDAVVGKVLDELAARGLEDNTLIVFFSDNGGARANSSNNGSLRDFKQSVYEGGIRVPFLIGWPGVIPPGSVFPHPVICLDILPTAAAAAGVALPADREFHGKNLLPFLTGKVSGPVHEWLFWDGDEQKLAVRNGRWKLVDNRGQVELFDLEEDIGEQRNLAAANPEVVTRLQAALAEWRKANAPRIRNPAAGAGRAAPPAKPRRARNRNLR